jgi:dihydrofolate synthase/folylpolyglutamate synthase
MSRSLAEWLHWQQGLHSRWMELGLDRVRRVAERLAIGRPAGPVFTVAGTNGKGSTVSLLDHLLRSEGLRVGAYTSPHLVRYNERIRIAGQVVDDKPIVEAFERIDAARGDTTLTVFEFGTLAALLTFDRLQCDAWVLEVGLGGRLDAVNIVDPDFSLITTIGLDHQDQLGSSIEAIAGEKAGIMRPGVPAYYGDHPVPSAIRQRALALGAPLRSLGEGFGFTPGQKAWTWSGRQTTLPHLACPPYATPAQLRNASVALAALEDFWGGIPVTRTRLDEALRSARPPGRFQIVMRRHEWVLDVAHNPQAAAVLREQLRTLPPADTSIVLGMLADKDLCEFVAELEPIADAWIASGVDDPRALGATAVADALRSIVDEPVEIGGSPVESFQRAENRAATGSRIVICGSFRIVGPALEWLGIY